MRPTPPRPACRPGARLTWPCRHRPPCAQAGATPRPPDKPPIAQGWIDIATFASPGMPGGMAGMMMGGMGGGGGDTPMSALFGGKKQGNQFGLTHAGGSGSYVDVTVRTSRNPSLAEAMQAVPAGHQARADAAAEGAATGQAGCRPRRRLDRGADRATQGQDQAVLGLRHDRSPGPAEGGRLRRRAPIKRVRRDLQGPARDATRHARGTGTSGVAEPRRQPPGAGRRVASRARMRSADRACRKASSSRCRRRRTSCRRSPCSSRRPTASRSCAGRRCRTARAYFIAAMGGKGDDSGAAPR